jgi:predicted TIM-barrel fold metal-dependent hydrolase
MRMFPEMKVIVAHMGQFETRRHLDLMEHCPNMYLDTTAALSALSPIYREGHGASPADVTDADLVRWQDRILFGSDFPNTPHSYEEERRPIWERRLPDAVCRKIFYANAARLLGL